MLKPTLNKNAREVIERFIKDKVEMSKVNGVVLGLSGGLDSVVVAYLCAAAIGPEKVHAIMMPEEDGLETEIGHAQLVVKKTGINGEVIPIDAPMIEMRKLLGYSSKLSQANLKARTRMLIIYHKANEKGLLVMGTSNKSEALVGYFTKYGDGGADYLPIGDLYKTQVRMLAMDLGVPEEIITKPPTAGLWPGQTDEKELGMTYAKLDEVLFGIERGLGLDTISHQTDTLLEVCKKVQGMVEKSAHKRRRPIAPKLSIRTIGLDWRES